MDGYEDLRARIRSASTRDEIGSLGWSSPFQVRLLAGEIDPALLDDRQLRTLITRDAFTRRSLFQNPRLGDAGVRRVLDVIFEPNLQPDKKQLLGEIWDLVPAHRARVREVLRHHAFECAKGTIGNTPAVHVLLTVDETLSTDDLGTLFDTHIHDEFVGRQVVLHPAADRALFLVVLEHASGRPRVGNSLAENRAWALRDASLASPARQLEEVRAHVFQVGKAEEVLELMRDTTAEELTRMLRIEQGRTVRVLLNRENSNWVGDHFVRGVLERAPAEALTDEFLVPFLQHEDQEIRLLAMSRLGDVRQAARATDPVAPRPAARRA